jgi:lysophospholipase L1-like esterase
VAGGLHEWATVQQRPPVQVASLAQPGCGFIRGAQMFADTDGHFGRDCDHVLDEVLPATLAEQHPDVVVAMVTLPDVLERTWSAEEGALRPTDARYLDRLRADVTTVVDELAAAGVRHVVWVVGPPPSERAAQNFVYTITDAEWTAYVDALQQVAVAHAGLMAVVRLDRWMGDHEPDDGSMRPDGVHLTPRAARQVVDAVVGPAVLATGVAS